MVIQSFFFFRRTTFVRPVVYHGQRLKERESIYQVIRYVVCNLNTRNPNSIWKYIFQKNHSKEKESFKKFVTIFSLLSLDHYHKKLVF
jgi:hypothetical protein